MLSDQSQAREMVIAKGIMRNGQTWLFMELRCLSFRMPDDHVDLLRNLFILMLGLLSDHNRKVIGMAI